MIAQQQFASLIIKCSTTSAVVGCLGELKLLLYWSKTYVLFGLVFKGLEKTSKYLPLKEYKRQ